MNRLPMVVALVAAFLGTSASYEAAGAISGLGPASPGTAWAEYDFQTGQIIISVDGVNNWFVERVGFLAMTGDSPNLPASGGLVTDNDTRIGESTFGTFSNTDLDLGNVAASFIPVDNSLQIFWNAGLGSPLESFPIIISNIPEPTTLALAGLGLSFIALRRRRNTL